jgi:hypothetical protein
VILLRGASLLRSVGIESAEYGDPQVIQKTDQTCDERAEQGTPLDSDNNKHIGDGPNTACGWAPHSLRPTSHRVMKQFG